METDFGFGFHRKLHLPPPPNLSGFSFETSRPNTCLTFWNPHSVEDSMLRTVPLFPDSGLQQLRASEQNVSQNQFNCMPQFPPTVAPAFNSSSENGFRADPFYVGQQKSPTTGAVPARKRFLVFDQSGDKTTLMYTSGGRSPGRFGTYQFPNPPTGNNLSNNEPRNHIYSSRPDEDMEQNSQDGLADEMHEDTEELNALLYSDSDSEFLVDDEVTSTAHSPSTMTDKYVHTLIEETSEEVGFPGPAKRLKLYDGYGVLPNSHTVASSLKVSDLGSDTESCCSNCNDQCKEEFDSLSSGKRSRKERVRGTLSILRSIIPNVEGKGATDVISEAICYLKSLKVKAEALGLNSL